MESPAQNSLAHTGDVDFKRDYSHTVQSAVLPQAVTFSGIYKIYFAAKPWLGDSSLLKTYFYIRAKLRGSSVNSLPL